MKNNFLQFELWHDCNNGCLFCHNKDNGTIDKHYALEFVSKKISDLTFFINFNELGYIGGEFFDVQLIDNKIFNKFIQLIRLSSDLIKNKIIDKLYVTSALMFNDTKYLCCFLDEIYKNNIANRVLLCTSYDLVGRFNNIKSLINWEKNMKFIHTYLPQLQTHIEMIVTGEFISQCLNNRFNILDFSNKFNSRIDFISPHIIDYKHNSDILKSKINYNSYIKNFFPTRNEFLQFVQKFMINTNILDINTFLSKEIRADCVYTIINNQYYVINNRRKTDGIFSGLDKKLGITYIDGYLDSDIKMEDDIEQILCVI